MKRSNGKSWPPHKCLRQNWLRRHAREGPARECPALCLNPGSRSVHPARAAEPRAEPAVLRYFILFSFIY